MVHILYKFLSIFLICLIVNHYKNIIFVIYITKCGIQFIITLVQKLFPMPAIPLQVLEAKGLQCLKDSSYLDLILNKTTTSYHLLYHNQTTIVFIKVESWFFHEPLLCIVLFTFPPSFKSWVPPPEDTGR